MPSLEPTKLAAWYRESSPSYLALGDTITATITSLLKAGGVDFLTISSRVKTLESMIEKVTRKEYGSLDEMTDILGVRIILYLESDVNKACALLATAFNIHPEESINKSEELAVDQIGYRSIHYICDLGEKRLALPELSPYKGRNFEIQIQTILQHAWAEIEHDRSYKFPGDLPPKYRRRLNLLSGTLELVDREFSTLASDLDTYSRTKKHTKSSAPLDSNREISPIFLKEYIDAKGLNKMVPDNSQGASLEQVVDEIRRFGISTMGELDETFTAEFLSALKKFN